MKFIVGMPHSGEVTAWREYEDASVQVAFNKKPSLLAECVDYYNKAIEEELLIGKLLRSRSNTTIEIAPHFMLITKLLKEVFPKCHIVALRKKPLAYKIRQIFPGILPLLDLSDDSKFFTVENALYEFMLSQTPDVEVRWME